MNSNVKYLTKITMLLSLLHDEQLTRTAYFTGNHKQKRYKQT